jgi:hypothetical protein
MREESAIGGPRRPVVQVVSLHKNCGGSAKLKEADMPSIRSRASGRFWAAAIGGSVTGLLLVLTLVWPEWIEMIFHVDPDDGSGALEVAIVVACSAATLLLGALARRELPRAGSPFAESGLGSRR